MIAKKIRLLVSAAAIATVLLAGCSAGFSPDSVSGSDGARGTVKTIAGFTANVMAPLHVNSSDWTTFENQLTTVKNYGVDAVSVDVWWGDVEGTADNTFVWTYYDTMFSKIKAKGLKIVPILSFHQCGGNVGDTYTSYLPSWLWTKYVGSTLNGVTITANDLKYKSEQGNYSAESVAGWADSLVANEYTDFVNAFKSHFSGYASDFQEINVSLGPAGELRYPSYNSHDSGSSYPTRGALQCYSSLAIKDFQNKMIAKYGSLAGINAAWGSSLTSTSQLSPPTNLPSFFTNGDYKNITYGKDFVDWYNQSLVTHGITVLNNVIATLGTTFPSAKIGYKVPGVHWCMTNPSYPRAAEVAAGLIQTSVDFSADATGHGYAKIIGVANSLTNPNSRGIVVHFTCLEMDDQNYSPQYSLAKSLVFWFAQQCARSSVTVKGENALSGGVTSDAGWNNIENAFTWASYSGLTTLRIADVASGTGATRYAAFIPKYR